MAKAPFNPRDDEFTRNLIQQKARRLAGRPGFARQDGPSIEQDLYVRVLQCIPHYDPALGHVYSFITAVVDRACINMLRDKLAAKRNPIGRVTLSVVVDVVDGERIELGDTITNRELHARTGGYSRDPFELLDLSIDLDSVIAELPPEQQQLCDGLKTDSVSEYARQHGKPRTTISSQIRRLRQTFEDKGLQDYFE